MLEEFSCVVADLYEMAATTSPSDYPEQTLLLLRKLICFDGAIFGVGEGDGVSSANLKIGQAYVYQRDLNILEDYAPLAEHDPIASQFLAGLKQPVACTTSAFYRERGMPELQTFCRHHTLSNIMLFGSPATAERPARWIVLYRSTDNPFNALEMSLLHAIWRHVMLATLVNLNRCLNMEEPANRGRCCALVNAKGYIEASNARFLELLREEWPDCDAQRVPPVLLHHIRKHLAYRGKTITVKALPRFDLMLCQAEKNTNISTLSHSEAIVATRFANGLSHKEIAIELGISHHTVRAHIVHIYHKLGVNDKAKLANLLSRA